MPSTEGKGAAHTWRFTPHSVRAALDAGWTAGELREQLAEISTSGVPQPLEYLISDVSRKHGTIRVRGVRACVVTDEATATEIVHNKSLAKLHLSLIAPTVIGSQLELDDVLAHLRNAGYAPVAEDAHGSTITEARPEHEAADVQQRQPRPQREQVGPAELAERLLADPHGEQLTPADTGDTLDLLSRLHPKLSVAELRLLADAVDTEADVLIGYRDKNGTRTSRTITPEGVYGRWIDSWCHLRGGQRDFTVANIVSVSPA